MEKAEAERREKLVAAIVEKIPKGLPPDGKHHPYYLLNYENPVVNRLYRAFRKKRGLPEYLPMSDRERTEFELLLFQPFVLARLEESLLLTPAVPEKTEAAKE